MYDPTGGLVVALFALGLGVLFFFLFGRLIGWLLGISTISKNQQIIIEQSEELIEIMKKSLKFQQTLARKQDVCIEGGDNSEAVNLTGIQEHQSKPDVSVDRYATARETTFSKSSQETDGKGFLFAMIIGGITILVLAILGMME